jgi:hypothetical protein
MYAHKTGQFIRLPSYEVARVNCWRGFVEMYPASIFMLRRVLETRNDPRRRDDEVIFAVTLLAVLAISVGTDWRSPAEQTQAPDVLRSMMGAEGAAYAVHDYRTYRFQRELRRALVEAGAEEYSASANDLLYHSRSEDWELRHLRDYGWYPDAETLLNNARRKLENPTLRDKNTEEFHTALYDVVSNKLNRRRGCVPSE